MRSPRIPRVCSALVSALFILLAGCANPSSTSLNSLSLKVTPATVSVGGAATLQAIAHLSDGTTQDVTSSTQWTLSNPSLATLGNDVLTSKAPGTLTVQAAYVLVVPAGQSSSSSAPQTLSSSAQVTITPAGATTTTPAITWSAPAPIQYGTALSSAVLDATANVPGSFAYTPAAGTVLKTGPQTLTAVFTPSDTTTYSAATATVQLTVNQASPVITWAPVAAITQGTALSSAQLDATANVPGTFSYSPSAGAVPPLGTQPLTATFTPSDAIDYMPATAHNSLPVDPAGAGTPTISWAAPAAISYGTALSSTQLNATANVAGTFTYTPAAGTVLKAGTQTLSAVFTPTDTSIDSAAKATVQLTVTKANPVIAWPPPSAIQQGTAISATQLDATANVPGTFSYSPAAGTVPPLGTQPLTATFTPSDATDYVSVTAHNSLPVVAANTGKSSPLISWSAPAAISYGTALSSTQLNATASVAGTFTYTPAAGTVLKTGTQTLSAVFSDRHRADHRESSHSGNHVGFARPHRARNSPGLSPAGRYRECTRCVCLQSCRRQRACSRHSAADSHLYSDRHHRLRLCHGAQHPRRGFIQQSDQSDESNNKWDCLPYSLGCKPGNNTVNPEFLRQRKHGGLGCRQLLNYISTHSSLRCVAIWTSACI
jgi:hypothetical protein